MGRLTGAVGRVDEAGLATLLLDRRDKLNSLTPAMFADLDRHVAAIARSPDSVGAVLLRGAGRCFSAGNDISGIGEAGDPLYPAQVIDRLAALPQPVVVAVHGYCFTGALELALAADLILASDTACFADTHARFGLTPLWGMSQRLPRRVGQGAAREMMFTGRRLTASEALAMRLVDRVLPEETFDEGVATTMAAILAGSWSAHRHNKRILNETAAVPLEQGLARERAEHPGLSAEARERLAGFAG